MTVREFLDVNLPGWFQKNKEVAKHLGDMVENFQIRKDTILILGFNGYPIEANKKTGRVIRSWVFCTIQ